MRPRAFLLLLAVGLMPPGSLAAQSTADAAYLFGYRIKPGMEPAFTAGYRRHLDWHARNRDSLTWLAWFVTAGPSQGMFVDGTFGLAPKAFDDRVNPREDGQDADTNVTAFADPALREVYRLRRDLGTGARLEAGKPAPMQLVAFVELRPGGLAGFEQAAAAVRSRRGLEEWAVYERVAGGDAPGFVLVVQVESWARLGDGARDPVRALLREADAVVERAVTEIWSFREDLTYYGTRGGAAAGP